MKLNINTYQVSFIAPILMSDESNEPKNNTQTYPRHRRVRASTATRAIRMVHRELVNEWDAKLKAGVIGSEFAERVDKFLSDGRLRASFLPGDFPIMEVKVVA